jgi:hypothetical protein
MAAGITGMATVRDTLHNLHRASGGSADYARGVLVGAVGVLMAGGMLFREALAFCSANAPDRVIPGCVPPGWLPGFGLPAKPEAQAGFWQRSEGQQRG